MLGSSANHALLSCLPGQLLANDLQELDPQWSQSKTRSWIRCKIKTCTSRHMRAHRSNDTGHLANSKKVINTQCMGLEFVCTTIVAPEQRLCCPLVTKSLRAHLHTHRHSCPHIHTEHFVHFDAFWRPLLPQACGVRAAFLCHHSSLLWVFLSTALHIFAGP